MNIRTLGLLPFLLIICDSSKASYCRCIALFVLINGILCHEFECVHWDILCNIIFCLIVNLTTTYKPTLYLTLIALIAFMINQKYKSWFIHIFFVQWTLAYCLYKYCF